ncbi:NAD(P)-dependent oxidoreductase [Salmonella enterica]
MTMQMAFIGYGEAGGIFAETLAKDHEVTVWDSKLEQSEREAMLEKARRSGVMAAPSLDEAVKQAAIIFSTVTAGSALEVARQCARYMQPGQIFLDLNSVSPETKRQAADAFLPGAYIDVAVMAPVLSARLQTPLLVGGPQGFEVTRLLCGLGFSARFGSEAVGNVSAIKMCRSVMIKGLEALVTECLFAARTYGVEDDVLASLHATFPSLGWDNQLADYLISRVAEHGIRRSEEMVEVVKTLQDVGYEALMSQSTAKTQRYLPQLMTEKALVYRQLEPFSWRSLADKLVK